LWNEEGIRLVGVSLAKFSSSLNHQISIFEDVSGFEKDNELDKILDDLKKTYGSNVINRASNLKK